MKKLNRLKPRNGGLLGTIFGGLVLVPTIPLVAVAQSSKVLNPCPRIYYEEPFNSTRLTPENCPANAATRLIRQRDNGITFNQQPSDIAGQRYPGNLGAPTTPTQVVPSQPARLGAMSPVPYYSPGLGNQTNPALRSRPPLPENRSQAVAIVMPMNGNVSVRVKNNTNAIITYEAIGYTPRRVIPGGQETTLRNLPLPVTVTFTRQDNGFVQVMPMSASKGGVLEVGLNEDKNPVDNNQGVIRIQKDGKIFLN